MKNVLMFILALVIVYFVWHVVIGLFAHIIGTLFAIGMIILFCYFVYAVYRLLTRQKI